MKKLTSAVAALGFVAMSAQAAVKTQYLYQADADRNVVEAGLGYSNTTTKLTGGNKNEIAGLTVLNLQYERGLNDMFSVGASIPWALAGKIKATGSSDDDYTGLGNLNLYGKGTYALADSMQFQFGLALNLGLNKQKITATKQDYGTNTMMLAPFVAYVMDMGGFNLGAKLSFELMLNKGKRDNAGTDQDVKGGETTRLAVFGEMPFSEGLVGLAVAYRAQNTFKYQAAGAAESAPGGANWIDVDVYGNWYANEMITVIPSLGYSMGQTKNSGFTKIDSQDELRLGLAGRFVF